MTQQGMSLTEFAMLIKDKNASAELWADIKQGLEGTYLDAEPAMRTIFAGILSAVHTPRLSNVILHGKGGFGKSEIASAVLERLDLNHKVIDFHKAITQDEFLGGMNFVVWSKEGRIKYNLDLSMFAHEIVVLEEGLSAPAEVLASMRNILTSGIYRYGGEEYEIKTKLIIICTNQDPAQYMSDVDIQALLQRYPYKQGVDWSHISQSKIRANFRTLINRNLSSSIPSTELDTLCIALSESQSTPRVAIQIARMINTLRMFNEYKLSTVLTAFDLSSIDIGDVKRKEAEERISVAIRGVDEVVRTITKQIIDKRDTLTAEIIGPAAKLLHITKTNLDDLLKTENEAIPGVASDYVGKVTELATYGERLAQIAGQVVIKQYMSA